jgi:hypothetical protein
VVFRQAQPNLLLLFQRTNPIRLKIRLVLLLGTTLNVFSRDLQQDEEPVDIDAQLNQNAQVMIDQGRETFRFDTFGDEAFWGDTLRLHEAIKGEGLG